MKDKDLFDIPKEFRLISAAEVADILAVSPSHLCAMRLMKAVCMLPMLVQSERLAMPCVMW